MQGVVLVFGSIALIITTFGGIILTCRGAIYRSLGWAITGLVLLWVSLALWATGLYIDSASAADNDPFAVAVILTVVAGICLVIWLSLVGRATKR